MRKATNCMTYKSSDLGCNATWVPAAIKSNALVNDIRTQLGTLWHRALFCLYIGLKVRTELDWPKLYKQGHHLYKHFCTAWNSYLHVLISSLFRVPESRAMHGIPLGRFSFPHLRKGKISFFIITDLIVIFKLFLSSLPLSHCFSSFHSRFLFISFFFHLLVFSLLFSDLSSAKPKKGDLYLQAE